MLTEDVLKALILRYERKIFAFSLSLVGGDKDRAYAISVSSSADALKRIRSISEEGRFPAEVSKIILEQVKAMDLIPSQSDDDLEGRSPEEKSVLKLVRSGFLTLCLEDKALILLRDQMNLSYHDVGYALSLSQDDARSGTIQARLKLRKRMEEVIRRER